MIVSPNFKASPIDLISAQTVACFGARVVIWKVLVVGSFYDVFNCNLIEINIKSIFESLNRLF